MDLVTKYKNLFWDISLDSIDLEVHKRFIIERILENGTSDSVNDMFDIYTKKNIIEIILDSRRISRRTRCFWINRLDIKVPVSCIKTQLPNQLTKLWD